MGFSATPLELLSSSLFDPFYATFGTATGLHQQVVPSSVEIQD